MELKLGPRSEDASWITKYIIIILFNQKLLLEMGLELGPRREDGSWIMKLRFIRNLI